MLIALLTYPHVAMLLEKAALFPEVWNIPVSFLISIIVIRFAIAALTDRLFNAIPRDAHYHSLNKILGILPGAVIGLIYAALISTLFFFIPFSETLGAKTQESRIAEGLTGKVQWVESKLSPLLPKAGTSRITAVPESERFIKLPYKVSKFTPRPDLEAEMLVLLNREREERGLRPLKVDSELTEVARNHSKDMFLRGYFSHYSIEKKDPFDRMRSAGVKFSTAGENLALAQNLTMAHTGLMNSPGHKANILQPAFGRVGIGILDGGIYGLMITQNFKN